MARESWYPNFEPAIPYTVKEAFRRVLDFIYEQRDQRGPLALWVRGQEIEQVIDVDPVAVTGCAITLPRSGNWLVTACLTLEVADAAQLFTGLLRCRATPQQTAVFEGASGTTVTAVQQWLIAGSMNEVISLAVQKEGGGGASNVLGTQTTLSAVWAGNN
jgi:hypothetical protein